MAPVEAGEDMAPVGRALKAASAGGAASADPLSAPSGTPSVTETPKVRGRPPRSFPDWLALLDAWRPDVAVVNPPFHRIAAVARECLSRGVHVLAEKPLATGWADFMSLRGQATSGGPRLMGMFTMRYDGVFRAARKAVAEGAIGAPVLLTAQKSYPLEGWDGAARPAFYRKRSAYGGSIPWVGIHPIDLFQWFTGSAFVEVYAAQTTAGNGGQDELESAAVMQFKLASGALAVAHLDFLRRRGPGQAAPVTAAGTAAAATGVAAWGDDRLRVAGDQGVLEVRDGSLRIEGPDGVRTVEPEPSPSLFADFLDWVEKGEPMALTTQDCLRAVEAALRARDAADWGRVQAF